MSHYESVSKVQNGQGLGDIKDEKNNLESQTNMIGNNNNPDEYTQNDFFTGNEGNGFSRRNKSDRTILPDLKDYPLTEDIKQQADLILNKMHYQVRRGKIRTQLIFYCVYCAYLEFDIDVNPIRLGEMFGLTPGKVQRCDSLFSPLQTGYRPRSTTTTPMRYLPDYCQQLELTEDAVREITQLAVDILKKEPALYQESPQTVAAGILKYYTETNGITSEDPQKITKVTGRSSVTIDGIYRRISSIDNS